jgi:Fe2+ transport system protein FeoA
MVMLDNLKPNQHARIVIIEGEHHVKQRLLLQGISEGTFIRCISTAGPVVFEIEHKIFSIGRTIAHHIRVIEVPYKR